MHTQPAVARVVPDIGALGLQLRGIHGHHVAVAVGEKGLLPGGRTVRHTHSGLSAGGAISAHGSGGGVHGNRGGAAISAHGSGGGGVECGNGFRPLHHHLPITAVAAQLKAGYEMADRLRLTITAEYPVLHYQQEMQVLRHDDVVLNVHHRITGGDAVKQFFLYHRANGGKGNGSIATLGITRQALYGHDGAEGLSQLFCHMQGDVVDAGAGVVVSGCSALHAVVCLLLFHFFIPAVEPPDTLMAAGPPCGVT